MNLQQASTTPLYIGLGSNLGDSIPILKMAIHDIVRYIQESMPLSSPVIWSVSSLYRSRAVEVLDDQPDYWNAVIRLSGLHNGLENEPSADPTFVALKMLEGLQYIESKAGRVRRHFHAARTLDLDLLLFGQLTCDLPTLQLPHPGIAHRLFVLKPLSELTPNVMVPLLGQASTLLQQLLQQKNIHLIQPIECVSPPGWEKTS